MNIFLSAPLWISPIGISALLVALRQSTRLDLPNLAAAVLVFVIYLCAVLLGSALPLDAIFGELDWNWGGKLVATGALLAMIALATRLDPRHTRVSLGVTSAQRPGSLGPALAALALITVVSLVWSLVEEGSNFSTERLLFQAFMPSIDEELWLRGLMLGLLTVGLGSGGGAVRVLGAPISAAAVTITAMFALPHGLSVGTDGALSLSWESLGLTFFFGAVLVWLRERTGSVLMPMVGHSLINLAASF